MSGGQIVDVGKVIDEAPLRPLQITVTLISALIVMIDGYDTLCAGFAAPALARELGRPVETFGPVFAAGLLGLVLGSIAISPLADRIGRKKVLIASLLIFGGFTLAPIFDLHFERLILYRFLTGLGLGSAMPCVIALTTEFAPRRYKALLTNVMFVGFPVGGALGGILASTLIEKHGWQSIFLLGGLPPLLIIPIVMLALPESVAFLVSQQQRASTVAGLLNRLEPAGGFKAHDQFIIRAEDTHPGSVRDLFTDNRAAGTILIWLVLFCTLFVLFNLASWLPAVMQQIGATAEQSVRGPVMMLAGGVVGGLTFGLIIDRIGAPFFLSVTYLTGAVFTFLIGQSIGSYLLALLTIFVTGICINGGQLSMNGFTARFYPVNVRSTGVGWALGIGRLGAVVGPVIGGMMLADNWSLSVVFAVIGIPSLAAGVGMFVMGVYYRGQADRR